jgi:hypothetical protein
MDEGRAASSMRGPFHPRIRPEEDRMISHLEQDIDVNDAFSTLGELAENPLHVTHLEDLPDDDEAFGTWNERLDCGGLELDVECQGARLA